MARFEYEDAHRSGRKKPWMAYLPLLFFAGVIALFNFSTNLLSSGTASRQMESLRSALINDITYCYATTGRYPMDLDEIKKMIDYFAAIKDKYENNTRPPRSVAVVFRDV